MQVQELHLMVSVPSKDELRSDIEEMQIDAEEHPENRQYFEIRKEIFEKQLAVLNDPQNAGINPNTLQGAEQLNSEMNRATAGLSQEAQMLLDEDPSLYEYGWSMLPRHWIPS